MNREIIDDGSNIVLVTDKDSMIIEDVDNLSQLLLAENSVELIENEIDKLLEEYDINWRRKDRFVKEMLTLLCVQTLVGIINLPLAIGTFAAFAVVISAQTGLFSWVKNLRVLASQIDLLVLKKDSEMEKLIQMRLESKKIDKEIGADKKISITPIPNHICRQDVIKMLAFAKEYALDSKKCTEYYNMNNQDYVVTRSDDSVYAYPLDDDDRTLIKKFVDSRKRNAN